MQRFIGSLLIITATTGAGMVYGAELQRYLEKLLYIRHIVYLLKGEMEYSNAPMGEVFARVAVRVKNPYKSWLKSMERQIENREEDEFAKIWNRGVDKYLSELHLASVHAIQLKELGTFMGQLNGDTSSRSMQLYINRLELEIEKMREGMSSKKRIGSCLGVMSGIFLVVILI
ncbi:stage III sporulation protein AB [Clostridium sp. C105KSO13]|uniref:stage III sporulation protein AB n=1 Tax=Clostridium sp. C105KSO13 TaxID=1776045 RepID=UPI000740583C|nr:stage III sporulation protein AB [Clostridium sp. C105KSO13]CUX43191.1 stage III sporulation protein SpoAB [Clostridium sp. C105KSO13]